jgi:hypothetical protein
MKSTGKYCDFYINSVIMLTQLILIGCRFGVGVDVMRVGCFSLDLEGKYDCSGKS